MTSVPDAPTPPTEAEIIAREIQRAGLANDPQMAALLRAQLRLVLRAEAVAARIGPVVPPEAVEAGAKAIAEQAVGLVRAEMATLARAANTSARWTRAGVLAGAVVAASIATHVVDRLALSAEVRRVEHGLALSLPAGSAWLDVIRRNPDPREGLAMARRWTEAGRAAGAVPLWLGDAPAPAGPKR